MSYHNGSVWPHDTALALAGMARYGERRGVARVLGQMWSASRHFGMRMPELFCGFARRSGAPPVSFPTACFPQAWAAGSTFMMLQACLGLSIDAVRGEVRLVRPTLPPGIDRLTIEALAIGDERLDLDLRRVDDRIVVGASSASRVRVVFEG
jgi:glycogen debranching enzyme